MNTRSATLAILMATAPASCMADEFKALAVELSQAAASSGVRSLAVLPFAPSDESPAQEGLSIADRLLTQIVRGGKVLAVERSMLRRVLEEHHLAQTGIADAGLIKKIGEIVPVGAVITGSFGNSMEETVIEARLIDVKSGIILAAAERKVERKPSGLQGSKLDAADGKGFLWVPAPQLTVAAPDIQEERSDANPAPGDRSCANAAERIDALEARILDVKARYWAGQLKKGVSLAGLTVNPGSEITDPDLKKNFYARIQHWYNADRTPKLTPSEISRFVRFDREAFILYKECRG